LDEESAQLTTEEAAIKAEEEKYQKALVNIVHASFMDFLSHEHRPQNDIRARKKKVTDAATQHSTLTGKLGESIVLLAVTQADGI
jgi:hypothetical protein